MIKDYNKFISTNEEWGYGGEGGVPSKDPVKVSDRMITDINLDDDSEEEESKDDELTIMFDRVDMSESLNNDPYEEEIWNDKIDDFKDIYDYLNSMGDEYIDEILSKIEKCEQRHIIEYIDEIVDYLSEIISEEDLRKLKRRKRELFDINIEYQYEEDDEYDRSDPDLYYDRKRENERN